jgi:Ser/Thr protein kinase RdoA (MazF antagonist)
MARAVGQFQRFAPDEPRLPSAAYAELVHRVTCRGAWRAPLPAAVRVVIPGYASLHAFSGAEVAAVKDGLRGRFWTLVHWTNWRMTSPSLRGQQERVARETMAALRAGRPGRTRSTSSSTIPTI